MIGEHGAGISRWIEDYFSVEDVHSQLVVVGNCDVFLSVCNEFQVLHNRFANLGQRDSVLDQRESVDAGVAGLGESFAEDSLAAWAACPYPIRLQRSLGLRNLKWANIDVRVNACP